MNGERNREHIVSSVLPNHFPLYAKIGIRGSLFDFGFNSPILFSHILLILQTEKAVTSYLAGRWHFLWPSFLSWGSEQTGLMCWLHGNICCVLTTQSDHTTVWNMCSLWLPWLQKEQFVLLQTVFTRGTVGLLSCPLPNRYGQLCVAFSFGILSPSYHETNNAWYQCKNFPILPQSQKQAEAQLDDAGISVSDNTPPVSSRWANKHQPSRWFRQWMMIDLMIPD